MQNKKNGKLLHTHFMVLRKKKSTQAKTIKLKLSYSDGRNQNP